MKTVELEMNGKKVTAAEGGTILEAARDNQIYIPTLCYHPEVEPYGACRLCMVEITKGNRKRLVAACVYPVEAGLTVQTDTEQIRKIRRMIMELLSPAVNDEHLLAEYGADQSRFDTGNSECSLCGLCVRYCSEARNVNAAYFKGRGINREVALVPDLATDCLYCGKCFGLCTGGWIVNRGENALARQA